MWSAVSIGLLYGLVYLGYGYWAFAAVARGAPAWPFVVAIPFAWLVVPAFVTLASLVLAGLYRVRAPGESPLGWRRRLRLVVAEFVAIAGHAPAMLLYRFLARDPAPAPAAAPVLLVHGVLCNAGVWHRFQRNCARHGIGPVYSISYGPPLASIDTFAEQLATRVDEVLAATGAPRLTLVAHSMGGLVVRAYLARYGGTKVRRVVTLGTPYEGSVHAYLMAGTSLSQLRPGNAWLGALGPPDVAAMPPIVSVWSWHDTMVAPQTSSRIAFGRNVEVAGVGHNALLSDPQVFARVAEEIRRP
jgi:triacylglycerol esterase/lipase EstA (alpha/beta hydrolase family)